MQQEQCPSCALTVDREAHPDQCPYCSYEFPRNKQGFGPMAWLMALLLILPLLWFVYKMLM